MCHAVSRIGYLLAIMRPEPFARDGISDPEMKCMMYGRPALGRSLCSLSMAKGLKTS